MQEKKVSVNKFYRLSPVGRYRPVRIGLLGGSFNPPHLGHLKIAQRASSLLNLAQVWWLISPQNPLKSSQGMAPLAIRQKWCQQVFAGDCRMLALDIELYLGTWHSAQTIRKLIARYPICQFVWIMGADNFIQLPKWYQWQDIVQKLPICVIDRQRYGLAALCSQTARKMAKQKVPVSQLFARPFPSWCFDSYRPLVASSTAIRRKGWRY